MCRGNPPSPPPSDDLHTSKDDAHAALSRYQEFVCRVAIRDSEKVSVSQSISQSVTDHREYYVNVCRAGDGFYFAGVGFYLAGIVGMCLIDPTHPSSPSSALCDVQYVDYSLDIYLRLMLFLLIWVGSIRVGSIGVESIRVESIRFGSIGVGSIGVGWIRVESIRVGSIMVGLIRVGSIGVGSNKVESIRFRSIRVESIKVGLIGVESIGVGWIRVESIRVGSIRVGLPYSIRTVGWLPWVAMDTEKCRCFAYSTPIRSICHKSKC